MFKCSCSSSPCQVVNCCRAGHSLWAGMLLCALHNCISRQISFVLWMGKGLPQRRQGGGFELLGRGLLLCFSAVITMAKAVGMCFCVGEYVLSDCHQDFISYDSEQSAAREVLDCHGNMDMVQELQLILLPPTHTHMPLLNLAMIMLMRGYLNPTLQTLEWSP